MMRRCAIKKNRHGAAASRLDSRRRGTRLIVVETNNNMSKSKKVTSAHMTRETLTQQFLAATVSAPSDSIPEITVVECGDVDDDPTIVMPRRELEVFCQVCGK